MHICRRALKRLCSYVSSPLSVFFTRGSFILGDILTKSKTFSLFVIRGALVDAINAELMPGYDGNFSSNHGLFSGVTVLTLTVSLMLPLRMLIDSRIVSEFTLQLTGTFMAAAGFCLGALALYLKQVMR